MYPTSTTAAEKIYFIYSQLEFSVSVSSLEKFTQEGTVDRDLAAYIKDAKPEEIAQLRKILSDRLNVGVVPVAQFLYSFFGEESLNFLGGVDSNGSSSKWLLRASLRVNFSRRRFKRTHITKCSKKASSALNESQFKTRLQSRSWIEGLGE